MIIKIVSMMVISFSVSMFTILDCSANKTTQNMFLNTIKHNKVVMEYAKAAPYLDMDNQSPEYLLEEEEFKTKLQNAIALLTDGQREVFLLNRIEGKKYREIATLLNLSQKAVEKRMSIALKTLKQHIQNI